MICLDQLFHRHRIRIATGNIQRLHNFTGLECSFTANWGQPDAKFSAQRQLPLFGYVPFFADGLPKY